MDAESLQFLLVTANVGSVFEDPSVLLEKWIHEFLIHINSLKPSFIALHLQEVGGKTYEKSMEYVQEFIKILCESEELKDYDKIRIYLDEDYNSAEHFTALGNLYFSLKTVDDLKIWNFLTHEWNIVNDKNIHTGNIESIATKEKAKFPQKFFPECKWSRKGFLKTRWSINGTIMDLVNIHLFHDASNLAACEEYPSVYCKSRRRALIHTLEKFHNDSVNGTAPYFVFGDFNFRCDTEGVVKTLTENLTIHRTQNIKNDHTKIQYRNSEGENILTVGKKEFTHVDHQNKFRENWLSKFDRELDPLKKILLEYPVTFPPSYPFEEDPKLPLNYMLTRCPAWCDRILLSPGAKNLIKTDSISDIAYGMIGENVCMGDHKPVYLSIRIKTNQGILKLCSCEHDALIINHRNSENAKHIKYCLKCSEKISKILLECKTMNELYKKPLQNSNNKNMPPIKIRTSFETNDDCILNNEYATSPLINVIDTDNGINICMCSSYNKNDLIPNDYLNINDTNAKQQICQICCNIIKQQPIEHRRTLISRSLKLSDNIFVNRIDTHYLNTFTNGTRTFEDPYTPESIESHSPQPEYNFGDEINNLSYEDVCSNEKLVHQHKDKTDDVPLAITNNNSRTKVEYIAPIIMINNSKSNHGVSPRQLKSRLERLKRNTFHNNRYDENKRKGICGDLITELENWSLLTLLSQLMSDINIDPTITTDNHYLQMPIPITETVESADNKVCSCASVVFRETTV